MTQRIFDVDNPQDVKDLFDVLPNKIVKIKWVPTNRVDLFDNCGIKSSTGLFRIAWRDKTEITRPVDESNLIGRLCWFWDKDAEPCIGVMKRIAVDSPYKYTTTEGACYEYCRPASRDEVKFVEDME